MKSDRFFKWVWNINGLVLLLGLIIGILSISYLIVSNIFTSNSNIQPTLNLAQDESAEEKWSLGYPRDIGGSSFYYIPLESEKTTVDSRRGVANFSSGGYKPTRSKNVIFIDSNTNKSKWLFNSVNQLITSIKPISESTYSNSDVKTISYEVINSDTNNDGKFDSKDKSTFALSQVNGSQYKEIIEGYSSIVELKLNDDGNLFVVFIDNDEVYSMLINLNGYKVIDKKSLPKVGDS